MADYSDDNINNDNQDFGDFNRNFDDDIIYNPPADNNEKNIKESKPNEDSNINHQKIIPSPKIRIETNYTAVKKTVLPDLTERKKSMVISISIITAAMIVAYYIFGIIPCRTTFNCSYENGCTYALYNAFGIKDFSKTFTTDDISNFSRDYTSRTNVYVVTFKDSEKIYIDNWFAEVYTLLYKYKYGFFKNTDNINYDKTAYPQMILIWLLFTPFLFFIGREFYLYKKDVKRNNLK